MTANRSNQKPCLIVALFISAFLCRHPGAVHALQMAHLFRQPTNKLYCPICCDRLDFCQFTSHLTGQSHRGKTPPRRSPAKNKTILIAWVALPLRILTWFSCRVFRWNNVPGYPHVRCAPPPPIHQPQWYAGCLGYRVGCGK